MKLIILGAGGFGRTIFDIAKQSKKYDEIYFLDDSETAKDTIGKCSDYYKFVSDKSEFYPAFGNNKIRIEWINKFLSEKIKVASVVHSSSYISPTASIGIGTVVLPNAVINTNVTIERGCIINCGSIIDHDCIIEFGVHICLGAIVKAENRIKEYSKIEAGEIVQFGTYKLKEN